MFLADVPSLVSLGGPDGLVPNPPGIDVGSIGFVSPASLPNQAPPPINWGIPEFSFVGRSNVGKSSLIKTVMKRICGAGKIGDRVGPRVGKTPGKTKIINYFGCWGSNEVDYNPRACNMFLIDLPGYGYAATAGVEERELWEERSLLYLQSRAPILQTGEVLPCIYENVLAPLNTCFLLVDSRRDPIMTELDFEYLDYLDENKIPVCVVLTKVDKISKISRLKAFNEMSIVVQQRHSSGFTQLKPEVLGCSSHTGDGIAEIVDYIKSGGVWRDEYYPLGVFGDEDMY
ncbi:hypothetical protein TL16_g01428 [Triparma laevis f. inornata]|uniref:EngB-type G domain-containing protein n=1 Tax=Triparma laevis f. inornata TaxID=1714386 RepID=A0A9W6ZMQ0_9STRA|nr:hypothetical protein TL16_g01428 [Triparma laevis f. inornata]